MGRLRHRLEQRGNEGGVVLAVAIESDDDRCSRMNHAA